MLAAVFHWLEENLKLSEISDKNKDLVSFEAAKARIAGLLMNQLSVSLATSLCQFGVKMILNVRLC